MPSYFPFPFFSSRPSRGYSTSTVTKKQGGSCGKTQYHPVMTAPYFSKVPLRGWRVTRVPLATPAYRVTRSFSLFLSHSFPRHGTHINHRHFNIGWCTIPPSPRYSAKLCREFDQQPSSLLPPETGFYGGILLICECPPLTNEHPPPMHTTFNVSPQLRKSSWRNVHRLAPTGRISRMAFVSAMTIGKRVSLRRECWWIYNMSLRSTWFSKRKIVSKI